RRRNRGGERERGRGGERQSLGLLSPSPPLPFYGFHRNRSRTSGLTTFSAGHSPRLSETIASAADSAMSSRERRSTPAACGVSSTLSSSNSGLLPGGSSSNTS